MDLEKELNRVNIIFFYALYPWFPLWAFISVYFIKLPFNKVLVLPAICLTILILVFKENKRLPAYLFFLFLFNIYHIAESFYFDTIPGNTNKIFYILSNYLFLASLLLFIVENTKFDYKFIKRQNKYIFIIIILALCVSLIQTQVKNFFFSPEILNYKVLMNENRIPSIFSWYDPNTLGITFPLIVSIAISGIRKEENLKLFAIIMSVIIVAFLTKTRYVMLSSIIVLSQIFFSTELPKSLKVKYLLTIIISVLIAFTVAKAIHIDIQQTIDERILEKDTKMASANARIDSYYIFILKFPEYPWFGVGPKTRYDVIRLLKGVPLIHVGYLSYLYWYGIVGASLLFISIFLFIRKLYRAGKDFGFWGGFYGLLAFVVANTTMVYFNLSEMGIIISAIYLKFYNDKPGLKYLHLLKRYNLLEYTSFSQKKGD